MRQLIRKDEAVQSVNLQKSNCSEEKQIPVLKRILYYLSQTTPIPIQNYSIEKEILNFTFLNVFISMTFRHVNAMPYQYPLLLKFTVCQLEVKVFTEIHPHSRKVSLSDKVFHR